MRITASGRNPTITNPTTVTVTAATASPANSSTPANANTTTDGPNTGTNWSAPDNTPSTTGESYPNSQNVPVPSKNVPSAVAAWRT